MSADEHQLDEKVDIIINRHINNVINKKNSKKKKKLNEGQTLKHSLLFQHKDILDNICLWPCRIR